MTDDIAADPRLRALAGEHPRPLLFATVSGAHLYGFASPDSDIDLRGLHVLPLADVVGLRAGPETIERDLLVAGTEMDIVSHDAAKFCRLLVRPNGYVLEQLLSPLVVRTTTAHAELVALAPGLFTRWHARHYLGFAETQRRLLAKEFPPRAKPLLYLYRVLLTGIHLLRSGRLEANLLRLNDEFKLPQLPDLIACKRAGAEAERLPAADLDFHERERLRLEAELRAAQDATGLPDAPPAREAVHDWLVRVRLEPAAAWN